MVAIMSTVFRPYRPSEAERSDRSAGDRLRHRQKVRAAIRDNIADIIAEEAIINPSRDRVIKVPLRSVKEYRFVYGENAPGVGQGDGNTKPGQVIRRGQGQGQLLGDRAGDRPGQDYYETDVTLEELIDIMFEDLELPEMERKLLREVDAERLTKRKGYRQVGIRVRLDKRRTVVSKLKRQLAAQKRGLNTEERFPFHQRDLTYRHVTTETRPQSNAVVICIMDTSGSMDTLKKYLARSFFFLLCQFVRTRYQQVEVAFIAHHTEAREVSEEEFFHKGESGGTFISSGYLKALEVIEARYHPSLWNIYAFHCSDGDNFASDNDATLKAAKRLCEVANLFGYGEIKPRGSRAYENSMLSILSRLKEDNYQTILIESKDDIWPGFKSLLARDRGRRQENHG
jgi:sporulation protein YhbH